MYIAANMYKMLLQGIKHYLIEGRGRRQLACLFIQRLKLQDPA